MHSRLAYSKFQKFYKVMYDLLRITIFLHKWLNSPNDFTSEPGTCDSDWGITSHVLFMASHVLFLFLTRFVWTKIHVKSIKAPLTPHFAIFVCGRSVNCGIVTLHKHVLWSHFDKLPSDLSTEFVCRVRFPVLVKLLISCQLRSVVSDADSKERDKKLHNNIKTVLSMYGDFHVKDKTAVRTSYL